MKYTCTCTFLKITPLLFYLVMRTLRIQAVSHLHKINQFCINKVKLFVCVCGGGGLQSKCLDTSGDIVVIRNQKGNSFLPPHYFKSALVFNVTFSGFIIWALILTCLLPIAFNTNSNLNLFRG